MARRRRHNVLRAQRAASLATHAIRCCSTTDLAFSRARSMPPRGSMLPHGAAGEGRRSAERSTRVCSTHSGGFRRQDAVGSRRRRQGAREGVGRGASRRAPETRARHTIAAHPQLQSTAHSKPPQVRRPAHPPNNRMPGAAHAPNACGVIPAQPTVPTAPLHRQLHHTPPWCLAARVLAHYLTTYRVASSLARRCISVSSGVEPSNTKATRCDAERRSTTPPLYRVASRCSSV